MECIDCGKYIDTDHELICMFCQECEDCTAFDECCDRCVFCCECEEDE